MRADSSQDELEALRQRVAELENELDRWKRHATIAVEQTLALRAIYAAANARADAAEEERNLWRQRAETAGDAISYEWQKEKRRADAAEKRVRELENAANLATQYLAGGDEHEAIAVLDKALAHDTTEAKDWEYLGLEEFAKGYAKDEQGDTPASPPPPVTDETLARMAEYYEQQEPPASPQQWYRVQLIPDYFFKDRHAWIVMQHDRKDTLLGGYRMALCHNKQDAERIADALNRETDNG